MCESVLSLAGSDGVRNSKGNNRNDVFLDR